MNAVEFLRKRGRMCKTFGLCSGKDSGTMCELYAKSSEKGLSCADYANAYPEEAVAIVERWAKEHPKKTRQSEFLKLFPNANIDSGTLKCCPLDIDTDFQCPLGDEESTCDDCKRRYWLAEMEDEING